MKKNKLNVDFKRISAFLTVVVLIASVFSGCTEKDNKIDYSQGESWAYFEADKTDTKADVFFVCPTVYSGDLTAINMPIDDDAAKQNFVGAINMEKGIYDSDTRFFAPYYRQMGLAGYKSDEHNQIISLNMAFNDVKEAFDYYLENVNNGSPIILAGFSQGADMCIRLLKDCFKDENVNKLLVACYAIGWRITEEEIKENPHIKFATGEKDTGVIIAFNSEADGVTQSLMIPAGVKTLAINPLNWKTQSEIADKSLNKGACFTDYSGQITNEIKGLCGAVIDSERGALKVQDISSADYPPVLDIFTDGIYHLYDYQFFYRNLQENVKVRIESYYSEMK